jgi:hypothetical protein
MFAFFLVAVILAALGKLLLIIRAFEIPTPQSISVFVNPINLSEVSYRLILVKMKATKNPRTVTSPANS